MKLVLGFRLPPTLSDIRFRGSEDSEVLLFLFES